MTPPCDATLSLKLHPTAGVVARAAVGVGGGGGGVKLQLTAGSSRGLCTDGQKASRSARAKSADEKQLLREFLSAYHHSA